MNVADTIAELRAKLDTLEAAAKAEAAAAVEPVVAAVEAPVVVAPVPVDAAAPVVAQDIEKVHARIDGMSVALTNMIQKVDAKLDGALDEAESWSIHPKVAAAAVGGTVATAAAYVAALANVPVDGGTTTGAGVAAIVAVVSAYLKRA